MNARRSMARSSILLLPLLFGACSPSAEQRLIGTWEADTAQIAEQAKAEGNPLAGAFGSMVQNASFTLELKAEGKMSHRLKFNVISIDGDGTWLVLDEDGDEATVEWRYNKPNTGEEVIDPSPVTFEGDDRIRVKPPGRWNQPVYFDRVIED
jgi:hypothetical protein